MQFDTQIMQETILLFASAPKNVERGTAARLNCNVLVINNSISWLPEHSDWNVHIYFLHWFVKKIIAFVLTIETLCLKLNMKTKVVINGILFFCVIYFQVYGNRPAVAS